MRRCGWMGRFGLPMPFNWPAPVALTWIFSSPTMNGSRGSRLMAYSSSCRWGGCLSEFASCGIAARGKMQIPCFARDDNLGGGESNRSDAAGTRNSVCQRRPRRHRGADADVRFRRWSADGRRHYDFRFRLLQRLDSLRCPRLLRHGERWSVLSQRCPAASRLQDARGFADGADGLDLRALHLRQLRPASGLHYFCGAGVLRAHDLRTFRVTAHSSRGRASVQSHRIPGFACNLYRDGFVYRRGAVTLQTAIHMAGTNHRAAWHPGVLHLAAASREYLDLTAGFDCGFN